MNFLDRTENQKQKERERVFADYAALVRKFAADGDLDAKDANAIERAAKALDIPMKRNPDPTVRTVERDCRLAREHVTLAPAVEPLAKLAEDFAAATQAADLHAAETVHLMEIRRQAAADLDIMRDAIRQQLDTAQRAADRRAEISRELFDVLGLEDPAVLDRRAHLYQPIRGKARPKMAHEEFVFLTCAGGGNAHGDPRAREFVPHEGQTAEELAEMLAVWCEQYDARTRGEKTTVGYLVDGNPDADGMPHAPWPSVGLLPLASALEWVTCERWDSPQLDLRTHRFIPHPGQDRQAFAALVSKVQAVWEKSERARERYATAENPAGDAAARWRRERETVGAGGNAWVNR